MRYTLRASEDKRPFPFSIWGLSEKTFLLNFDLAHETSMDELLEKIINEKKNLQKVTFQLWNLSEVISIPDVYSHL